VDKELELAKIKLELIRVSAARAELEFIVMQRESEIKRVKDNIAIQLTKEVELKKKIEEEFK
jgi:hypothetical protein